MGRGIYLGVKGAGTNMSDTGGLIVYKIISWKITTLEIKGGARVLWTSPLDTPLFMNLAYKDDPRTEWL